MSYGEIPVYVDAARGRALRLVRVEMCDTYAESEARAVLAATVMGYTNVRLFMHEPEESDDGDTLEWEYDPSVKEAHK